MRSPLLISILLPLVLLLLLPLIIATPLLLPQTTAFLQLDLLTLIVSTFAVPFPQGQTFISYESLLLSTLHSLNPQPLNIFTRIYFSSPTGYPELGTSSPFLPHRRAPPPLPRNRPRDRNLQRLSSGGK
jgi:hypothetical protein